MTMDVMGVRVVAPAHGDENTGLRAFNWSAGTTLAVLLEKPAGNLIELDTDASTVDVMTDDLGNDLLEGEGDGWAEPGFGMSPTISDDGTAAMFEIEGLSLPAENAKSVTAKGTLVVVSAKGTNEVEGDTAELGEGASLAVAGVTFKVNSAGASDWDPETYEVEFETKDDVSSIASLVFQVNGKPVEAQRGFTSRMGWGNQITTQWGYRFEAPVEGEVTLVAEVYEGLEKTEVPFELTTGLGLSE